jgi:hypothetical protein
LRLPPTSRWPRRTDRPAIVDRTDEQLAVLRREKPEDQLCADCRVKRLEARGDGNPQQLDGTRKVQVPAARRREALEQSIGEFIDDFFVRWFIE